MQLTRTQYCTGYVQVFVTTLPHWSLTFCTLNYFKLCTQVFASMDVYQLLYSSIPVLFIFRGCVCTDFRVYSGVGMVGVQLTKYSLDVQRENGRHGEPCNWSQDCVKHACIRRQRLSLASALLLPDRTRETLLLEFPSSRNRFPSTVLVMPKDCFSKIPLSRWTTHLPVTCWCDQCSIRGCSKTNFGRSHPKNSNWEGKIHCGHVQAQVLYWEQATEAVWLQICPALRVPVPRSFLLEFFLAFEALLLHKGKLSVCSSRMHLVYQSNEPNARTRRSKTPWGVGSKI